MMTIERTVFFETKRSMAVAISADLQMKAMLSAELERENAHQQILFKLNPQTGKLLLLLPTLTQEPDKHVCYMVTRTRERERVALHTLFKCLEELRDKLISLEITDASMPLKDSGRGHIDIRDFHAMLTLIFSSTEHSVHLHARVYLTTVW